MASPPKPWERAGAGTATMAAPIATTTGASLPATSGAVATTPSSATGATPVVPPRPDSLSAAVNQNASAYSRIGANPYNSAYSSPYSSPYTRMGGMGGMGTMGGMGGYGYGSYGGYGGGYGGMYGGGMYGGMPGMMPNDPNNPNSLTSRFSNSTQATFQMLEGIVGAFGGFSQMLESTYMATHSSFFAMVSVAEQFGNLRDTLGSVLGIFTLMRWIRTLIAKITGRPPPADAMALTPAAFARFEGRQTPGPNGQPKPSRKPLIFFLLAAFGLPYLMSKAIRSLAASAEEEERRRMEAMGQNVSLDPSKLEFCRVLYDFAPEAGNATQGVDLAVKKGDFIAVISKSDPLGNPSEWWRCRARDGRLGYLPATFLEVAKRPGQPVAAIKAAASESNSRTSSMTSASTQPPVITGKAGDISPESFQKSHFYS
ncbi:putative peroxisomal membrane protein [Rosellinia necatrix]|uniref:Peroxisomal membrane protein PEX13 n=1 Tax=Rosellinia necatrix TaxID=77044 RepID=A0A1S7ULX3_ROSNE|nr:putative peroxisomal membrane protein [Rosellinia necatrix]